MYLCRLLLRELRKMQKTFLRKPSERKPRSLPGRRSQRSGTNSVNSASWQTGLHSLRIGPWVRDLQQSCVLPDTRVDHDYEMRQLDIFKTMVEKGMQCVLYRIYAAHLAARAHL